MVRSLSAGVYHMMAIGDKQGRDPVQTPAASWGRLN